MAHGQPSELALVALQNDFEKEEKEPLLLFGLRGERAIADRFLCAVDTGEFTQTQLRNAGFAYTDMLVGKASDARAIQLRFANRAEQIAALATWEQCGAFERLEKEFKDLPFGSRMLIPAIFRIATACLASRARLCCASAAIGCERYRLARGTWPSGFDDLVPEFLPSQPIDPFDGQPLRFRSANNAVVIYSVGGGSP